MRKNQILAGAVMGIFCGAASAVVIVEAEPNDGKATANLGALVGPGDTVTGNTTGTSTTVAGTTSADYFRLTTPAQPTGIYRNRLSLGAGPAHVGTIRALSQTATGPAGAGPGIAGALDNTLQTSSASTTTPPRFNQWYSFGRPADIYYRVTGSTATTVDYSAAYTQDTVTPVDLGTYQEGSFEFTNTGLSSTQDTEVFIYDSTLAPVAGALNDDFADGTVVPPGGSTLNSRLVRNLASGRYYIAISNFNTADSQLSPADEGTASASVMDFAGVMANSSTGTLASIPFRMNHPGGTLNFTGVKPGAFDVYWATILVEVPEPSTLGLLALGLPALLRRSRR